VTILALQLILYLAGVRTPLSIVTMSLLSSAVFLSSQSDFESMAKKLSGAGLTAKAPAAIMGKSGVKHEFAFAVGQDPARAKVVVDTALSVNEVDEMKVLAFYVKVFDVNPEKAVLAVSPRLNDRAKKLAKEYKIMVVENEAPRNLIPMVAEVVEGMLNEPWKL
jgi:hypothetical protein